MSCIWSAYRTGCFFAFARATSRRVRRKAVAAPEEQCSQSEKTNNAELTAPLLADKFMAVGTDGKISDREKTLADAKLTKYDSVDIEHFHIAVFSRTAIATMVLKPRALMKWVSQ